MKRIISILTIAFFFLVPLQTVYLLSAPLIGKPQGVWQYGTIGLYATDVAVLALCICAIITCIQQKRYRPNSRFMMSPQTVVTAGAILLVAYSFISVVWSPDKGSAVYAAVRVLEVVAAVWALSIVRWSWLAASVSLVTMAAIHGGLSWYQFLQQRIDANKWLGLAYHSSRELGDSVVESTLRRFLRAYGLFPHPNMLGVYLAIALVICVSLIFFVRAKWQGWLLLIAFVSILSGLILTFSRAGWIAALLGVVMVLSVRLYTRKRIYMQHDHYYGFGMLMSGIALVTIVFMGYALWEPIHTRLGIGGLTRLETRSLSERGSSISEGIHQSLTALPWGFGIGQYTYVLWLADQNAGHPQPYYVYQPAHAVPLLVASELGIVGIIAGLLLFAGFVLFYGFRISRVHDSREAIIIGCGAGIGVVVIIAMATDHFLWSTHAGTMVAIPAIALMLYIQKAQAKEQILLAPSHVQKLPGAVS